MDADSGRCEWLTLTRALEAFVVNVSGHQGQGHIRPLHHYVASRLVVEGGFHPSEITPQPPFRVVERRGRRSLEYDPDAAGSGEQTVLGGLKTKAVDVVVTKPGIGSGNRCFDERNPRRLSQLDESKGRGDRRLHKPPHLLSRTGVRLLPRASSGARSTGHSAE